MGSRLTVFPRAAWASLRGLARDADVVLEVINGITFLTPLWLRRPRVAMVHHVHRDHYVAELGRPGAVAALLAETLPLRALYGDTTFLTISEAGRARPAGARPAGRAHPRRPPRRRGAGVPAQRARRRAAAALPRAPEAVQADRAAARRAGGDPRRAAGHRGRGRPPAGAGGRDRAPRAGRARDAARPRQRGGEGRAAVARVGQPDRLLGRGLVPDGDGGGDVRHAERGAGRRRAAGVDRRRRDRPARATSRPSWPRTSQRLVEDRELRERLGAAAHARAREFTWDRTARANLDVLEAEAGATRAGLRATLRESSETLKAAGLAAATLASNAIALLFTVLFARLLGRRRLRLAGRADLDLPDPRRARLRAAGGGGARDGHRAAWAPARAWPRRWRRGG